ncbi:tetratricopeptide repeat protein [Candidatus Venteria ishoeyi]|uniref:tetratricopeptide repeat protein n=1 Tax=Candidatus Venteria ishoeyi TaxID=1899563 RepID=UPI0025A616D9|nr:tetratricopeptide repeat protein [Candidatus Venteria ishoeyi]MDM8546154.1 tetratricopeptide repeat protein [Candidatus Venteria ishoeyi]
MKVVYIVLFIFSQAVFASDDQLYRYLVQSNTGNCVDTSLNTRLQVSNVEKVFMREQQTCSRKHDFITGKLELICDPHGNPVHFIYMKNIDLCLHGASSITGQENTQPEERNESITPEYEEAVAKQGEVFEQMFPGVTREMIVKKAEQGDTEAEVLLGVSYMRGWFGSVNYDKAHEYYLRAAKKGHPKAQVNLAIMYGAGIGVTQNETIARDWVLKAAAQGYPEAIEICKETGGC